MDLKALDPQWFRTKVSMVGQEPTLFACSIKDNISYGRDATMEEVCIVEGLELLSADSVHLSCVTMHR